MKLNFHHNNNNVDWYSVIFVDKTKTMIKIWRTHEDSNWISNIFVDTVQQFSVLFISFSSESLTQLLKCGSFILQITLIVWLMCFSIAIISRCWRVLFYYKAPANMSSQALPLDMPDSNYFITQHIHQKLYYMPSFQTATKSKIKQLTKKLQFQMSPVSYYKGCI